MISINQLPRKGTAWKKLRSWLQKTGGMLEFAALISLWIFIFRDFDTLGGFTLEEMITYLVIGHVIGLASGYFLERTIADDLSRGDPKILLYRPIRYFFHILPDGIIKFFLPFVILIMVYVLVILLFLENLVINAEPIFLAVIMIMIALSFITEFLIAYLVNMNIFWTVQSGGSYILIMRLKKFFAGNYFPLDLLPLPLLNASFALPFSYSFFVPTQLYLKKIDPEIALLGLAIQLVWIFAIFAIIKLSWMARSKRGRDR